MARARIRPASLPELMDARGWDDVVVKPAVSASAHRTCRVARADARARQADLDAILAAGDALVQPFASEVTREGEWSLLFLGGAFSHAVQEAARRVRLPRAGGVRRARRHLPIPGPT